MVALRQDRGGGLEFAPGCVDGAFAVAVAGGDGDEVGLDGRDRVGRREPIAALVLPASGLPGQRGR
jgi:hypothetical protein